MIEPTITPELVAKHNFTLDGTTHINLVTHPERVCEPLLGSDDGKWIFESLFAALKSKTVVQAA